MSDWMTLSDSEAERAARLHRESLVVDTLGVYGPLETGVYTPAMLDHIASLVEQKAPSMDVVMAMHDMGDEARYHGDALWQIWGGGGVEVVSHTHGRWGAPAFSCRGDAR